MNAKKLGFGWMAAWMFFGLILEGLLAFKAPAYLEDPVRREVWRLAHCHGALMGLVFACFSALYGFTRQPHYRLSLLGMVLMPLGFLLGGVATSESDPSILILAAPVGGVCFIAGIAFALAAGKGEGAADDRPGGHSAGGGKS